MTELQFTIKEENATPTYADFVIEPLHPGYGHTMGNALRRVLLSSIPGAAISSVKIASVKHKFSTLPGLRENIVDLLLNLKGVSFRLDGKESATVRISKRGEGEITAKDIDVTDGVEVVNKDQYIGYLTDKKAKLDIEMNIERGYGYMLAEEKSADELGVIPTDAVFSPVLRVNYAVSATRVGRQTDLDKLTLQVWTNGTISPKDALSKASSVLASMFTRVYAPDAPSHQAGEAGIAVNQQVSENVLKLTIDELDLPTRIYNSLRNGGIETLGQLLGTSRRDLMVMRNMGAKSIAIIEEKLREKGISLTV